MKINYKDLFPEDISDEAAYHLIHFFYNFALLFETVNLGKSLRHEKSLIGGHSLSEELDESGFDDEYPF